MLFPGPNTRNSPEKIRLGVEFEIDPLEIDIELRDPGVRHADGYSQEIGVLAKIERRGQHHHAELGRPSRSLSQPPRAWHWNSPRSPHELVPTVRHGASGSRRKCACVREEIPPRAGFLGDGTLWVEKGPEEWGFVRRNWTQGMTCKNPVKNPL